MSDHAPHDDVPQSAPDGGPVEMHSPHYATVRTTRRGYRAGCGVGW